MPTDPTPPFTAADVEQVREAFWDSLYAGAPEGLAAGDCWGDDELNAALDAVLSALAAAGRLRDQDTTAEWGWTGYDDKDPQRGMPLRDEEAARSVVSLHPGTQLVRRLVGPWLPVPNPTTTEGDQR